MSTEQGAGLDGMLKSILDNPEMFKKALDMAGKLSESGLLDSIIPADGFDSARQNAEDGTVKDDFYDDSNAGYRNVGFSKQTASPLQERHRKLLEVLKLYIAEDKREKLDLVIKLIDLMSAAKHLGL